MTKKRQKGMTKAQRRDAMSFTGPKDYGERFITFRDKGGRTLVKQFNGSIRAIKSDLRKDYGKLSEVRVYNSHEEMTKDVARRRKALEAGIKKGPWVQNPKTGDWSTTDSMGRTSTIMSREYDKAFKAGSGGGGGKASSRSAAAKKAWATRRAKSGDTGWRTIKGRKVKVTGKKK